MPPGLLATAPLPAPTLVTVRVNICGGARLKVAVQAVLAASVTTPSLQSAAPLQPAKMDPAAGAALSATTVPAG
jgi:hypothetical protein